MKVIVLLIIALIIIAEIFKFNKSLRDQLIVSLEKKLDHFKKFDKFAKVGIIGNIVIWSVVLIALLC